MAKLDGYLRSIERFGATGAVLTSGQAVTLRFPTGDRHATQVTMHDQLVAMVREVAPPGALETIESGRPVRFELDSGGVRYALTVQPRPGAWQVGIEPAQAPASEPAAPPVARPAPAASAAAEPGGELPIERGQYADDAAVTATSGSGLLDQLTAAARQARASDVHLATGSPPVMRAAGTLQPLGDRATLDGETLSRELGIVAPAWARAAWSERGHARFTYGDGAGRVRVTLGRDHRGPGASLRLLPGEPPPLDALGLPREVTGWLDRGGLVLVAGVAGAGKTTTLAALVRALGERRRRVVTLEAAIELVQTSPLVSQRAVGEHVPDLATGVAGAASEATDVIAIDAVTEPAAAAAVVDALAHGVLVVAVVAATGARDAASALVELVPAERRERGRAVVGRELLGAIAPAFRGAGRSFEVVAGRVEEGSKVAL